MRKNKNIAIGARVFSALFVLLFFVVMGRFVYIQATKSVQGHALTVLAEEKWTKERELEASRGKILDRNKMDIAKDVPTFRLYALITDKYTTNPNNPNFVTDPKVAATKLAPLIGLEVNEVERILSKQGVDQVEFGLNGRNIDYRLKEKIDELGISGIGFWKETKRLYPNGTFASHVIGYAKRTEEGSLAGQMGIEYTMEEYMKGTNGKVSYQSDRKGLKLPDPKELIEAPIDGNDVYLTIDQKIQTFLEGALSHVQKEYEPKKIIAIVANPHTGEILGMGTRPSFDPNIRDIENYVNDAISYPFEPGSTMKIFTLAAAVNEGVFPEDELYQSGSFTLSSKVRPIRDHKRGGWGKITFLEGVQRSSNVGFAILANEKLGTENLLQYLNRFGFNQKTGIDLPDEASGNILYRYPIEKITTSFGQGTTITPIQQIQAFTAIANGGQMMKPYVIQKIVNPNTEEIILENKAEVVSEPISEETSRKVREILETVVSSPKGTGKPYSIEGYQVAGKTGTAQVPDPKTGKYMYGHGDYIYSFLGLAQTDNPKLVMYVAVKQPKLEPYELGSEPVSYIFKSVMKNSLHYLNVQPTKAEKKNESTIKEGITVDSFVGRSLTSTVKSLEKAGIKAVVLGGNGNVKDQVPYKDEKLLPGERMFLKTDGKIAMPDMTGWSLRDVMKLSYLIDLKPNIIGNGYVKNQSIEKGTVIKKGDYLIVDLEPPYVKENDVEEPELELPPETELLLEIQD